MSWTISTGFALPTRAANTAAEDANKLKFSMIRAMYGQSTGGLSLSDYYRDGNIVTDTTYHDNTVNPFGNMVGNIPISDGFRMSQFRGAFKEHRVTVADETAPYNINPSTTEYRTYRYYVTGVVSSSTWDSNGNGISGMVVDVPADNIDNIRIIVHVTSDGQIGGGPGQGGGGGAAGAGGAGGTGGTGSQSPSANGDDADCSVSSTGGVGIGGSEGKRGGHCIEIVNYSTGEDGFPFYIYNYGELIPGGGGGGGSGGGGGGGAGAAGGGGGHGAYGYNETSPPPPPPPPSSDPRLKDIINKIGTYNGLNVYEWVWNDIATTIYGLRGREIGFLTTELDPEYIGKDHHGYGYIKNGTMISEALKEVRVTMTK
jgi:hypothetical protein